MKRSLDTKKLAAAMDVRGLSASALAKETGHSKEAVSNWCRGESQPRPAAMLKIALALSINIDDLLGGEPPGLPKVSFRKKARRKIDDHYRRDFARSARHLERLVPYLPEKMCLSDIIRSPQVDYEHIQTEALRFRERLGIDCKEHEVSLRKLLSYIQNSGAIIIPVPWGDKSHPVNGAHVHLPESKTDWLYLNIDTPVVDAKFWLLHEIAHMLTPSLESDGADEYADAFAQAVLWPKDAARRLHAYLASLAGDGLRIVHLKKLGRMLTVSPYTLYRAINDYAQVNGKAEICLKDSIGGAFTNVVKETPILSELVFSSKHPEPADYVHQSRSGFNTSFFESLAAYIQNTGKSSSLLCRILGLSTIDAMEIYGALTDHGATKTSA